MKIPICFGIDEKDLKLIDRKRGKVPRAEYIRTLIKGGLGK